MQSSAKTVSEYIKELPDERRKAISGIRSAIRDNLDKGFKEVMSYGMIGYVVPHERYPAGYHANASLPLPFINLASQKNFIALYHMAIDRDEKLMNWFASEYARHTKRKLDMGKSCIRFKNTADIPFQLIGELASKMSVNDWIALYESEKL